MMKGRFNPLAFALGLFVVLILGSAIFTATSRSPREEPAPMRTVFVEQSSHMPAAAVAPEPAMAFEPAPADIPASPDIAVTAAPGVAFNYRHAFRLGAERVAEVQEQHAAACEQLGITRCRITAMHYRVGDGNRVDAMLALKLDPRIARRFGRRAIDLVGQADGVLVQTDITGIDAETAIRSSDRSIAQLQSDLQRLERALAGRLPTDERPVLLQQAQQLRNAVRAAEADRDDERESLASTPVEFTYLSGERAAEPSTLSPAQAAKRALDTFLQGLLILFVVLVTLLPWFLLGLALWWLTRWLRRRLPDAALWSPDRQVA